MLQHQQGHVFLGLALAGGGGGSKGPARSGAAALHAGVAVGFVVIAKMNDIIVALGGRRKRLEADVIGAAIAHPTEHGGQFALQAALFPHYFQRVGNAGGRRTSSGKANIDARPVVTQPGGHAHTGYGAGRGQQHDGVGP